MFASTARTGQRSGAVLHLSRREFRVDAARPILGPESIYRRVFRSQTRNSDSQIRWSQDSAISKPADLAQDVPESMEAVLEQHAQRLMDIAADLESSRRYIVAVAGAPGSGKTSAAHVTCQLLNKLAESAHAIAAVLPMDGYHYSRAQLDQMDNSQEAHARRGAHWTFNAEAFIKAIEVIREASTAKAPSFDHALGDPVQDDIDILQSHKIVIVEGNYILLDEDPWRGIRDLVDETWFISCPIDTAMDRVLARQLANGSDLKTAQWRISNNDRPNAELIEQSSLQATYTIPSMPLADPSKFL